MRALIVGATGLLGHAFWRHLRGRPGWEAAGTTYDLPLPDLVSLDVRTEGAFSHVLERVRPEVVFFPASNPFVDYCERNPAETRRLNVEATLAAARASRAAGARFVFFSSDYVFDGARGGYCEDDPPSPLNEYGRQKLEVERELARADPSALVVRTSAIYGWELGPRNFVLQVLRSLAAGTPLRCARDQRYNPTWAPALAAAVAELAAAGASGLFHAAGSEKVSRLELARAVAEVFGFDGSRVESVPLSELCPAGGTPRPADSSLDSSRLARRLGRPLAGLREGLRAMKDGRADWEAYARGLPLPKPWAL
ncbi:MAG: SDR family oxidoreductase [Elusimicrobiota bacterium]|jgi:dTDP-4-dehydrorhamnose reductase